jgi:hypothetical protein
MFYDWNAFWRATVAGIFTYYTIHYILSKFVSRKNEQQHWKHINISTSFIHSMFSSIIGLYLLVNN